MPAFVKFAFKLEDKQHKKQVNYVVLGKVLLAVKKGKKGK
jgi:hypothetical protein